MSIITNKLIQISLKYPKRYKRFEKVIRIIIDVNLTVIPIPKKLQHEYKNI